MKPHEFNFYRWLAYGVVLLLLGITGIYWNPVLWAFLALLIIATADILYSLKFKR